MLAQAHKLPQQARRRVGEMDNLIAAALTIAGALFYGFIGVSAMARPRRLLRAFDLIAESAGARNEVRAVYGGLPLALSGALLMSLWLLAEARSVLVTVGFLTLAMAAARLASALIDRAFGASPRLWTMLELAVAAALLWGGALR